MDNLLLLSSMLGIIPAIFVFWLSIRRFDYPITEKSYFDDRKLFGLFAICMVIGTIVVTFENIIIPMFSGEEYLHITLFLIIYVIGFVFLEDMVKFIILNHHKIRKNFDVVYYGVSIGCGISATFVMGTAYISLQGSMDVFYVSALIVYSINLALLHSSMGAILGVAAYEKKGISGIPATLAPHFIFNLLMLPFFYFGNIWYSLIFTTPLVLFLYLNVYENTLFETLPEQILQERRRKEKRENRRKANIE